MRRIFFGWALAPVASLLMLGAAQAQGYGYGYCFAIDSSRVFVSAVESVTGTAGEKEQLGNFPRLISDSGYQTDGKIQCSFGPDRAALERARTSLVSAYSGALYLVVPVPAITTSEPEEGEALRPY